MTDARERKGWRLLFDLAQGKGAEVAAWLAVNDPFQDALPCFVKRCPECGSVDISEPNKHGWRDCYACDIWFDLLAWNPAEQ